MRSMCFDGRQAQQRKRRAHRKCQAGEGARVVLQIELQPIAPVRVALLVAGLAEPLVLGRGDQLLVAPPLGRLQLRLPRLRSEGRYVHCMPARWVQKVVHVCPGDGRRHLQISSKTQNKMKTLRVRTSPCIPKECVWVA